MQRSSGKLSDVRDVLQVEACDVVLGKIGYGTTSEVLATNTPLVFVRRWAALQSMALTDKRLMCSKVGHSAVISEVLRHYMSGP